MAFVDVGSSDDVQFRFYYVNMAVGKNAPNRKDDVMLVQYMLKRIYEKPVYERGTLSTQQSVMVVDGLLGPITIQWIVRFQMDTRRLGMSCAVDGRVDRASLGPYTITHINYAFKRHYPEIHEKMPVHPDVPPEIRAALLLSPGALG